MYLPSDLPMSNEKGKKSCNKGFFVLKRYKITSSRALVAYIDF